MTKTFSLDVRFRGENLCIELPIGTYGEFEDQAQRHANEVSEELRKYVDHQRPCACPEARFA